MAEILDLTEHADTVDTQVAFARIVVQQPDRRVAEPRVAEHLLDDQLRRVTGTDDDRLASARDDAPGPRPLDQRAGEQAGTGHEREAQQQIDEPDPGRDAHTVHLEQGEDEEDRDRRQRDAACDPPHVARRDVAPPAVVEPRRHEHGELHRDDQQHHAPLQVPVVVDGSPLVEAQLPGEVPRGGNEERVDRDLAEAVAEEGSDHALVATPAAASTDSTTRSWTSAPMPAHIGSARFSAAARSVSGSDPCSYPR